MTSKLSTLGFRKADPTVRKRLVVSVEAMEKQGKSHFSLTAPGPIALFDFDTGLEGVIHKFAKEKDIYVSDYRRLGNVLKPEEYLAMWERFKREYVACIQEGPVRTIIMDTATEVWELLRLARFGKLTQVMPYHYGPVNAEFRELIRLGYGSDKNLILLHKMKPEYVNDKSTGKYVRSGFGDTGFMVQVNIRLYRDSDNIFIMWIKDSRQNPDIAGIEIPISNVLGFPLLGTMVLPETQEKDWL